MLINVYCTVHKLTLKAFHTQGLIINDFGLLWKTAGRTLHCIPTEDLLPQRMHTGNLQEEKQLNKLCTRANSL
jgi:hypothetical protein